MDDPQPKHCYYCNKTRNFAYNQLTLQHCCVDDLGWDKEFYCVVAFGQKLLLPGMYYPEQGHVMFMYLLT